MAMFVILTVINKKGRLIFSIHITDDVHDEHKYTRVLTSLMQNEVNKNRIGPVACE